MTRRNFPDKVKAQIVHRAMDERGRVVCEGCGQILGSKRYEIDHTVAEALIVDKSAPLTAKDGKLLGLACCHAPKTVIDKGIIAKSKRAERKIRFGIKKPSSGFRKPPPGYNPWTRRIET